ncbi:MAG: DNA mismatch repair endonuclease MutL [Clostridia bacterium]|nr:DNA mismatch repair endonuclease MutL [Clostridia bacterium]
MSKINVLPQRIADLIAAGEVVERPSSVVKELLENSIDAGATQITVEIKKGGNELIRVTDNASGIEHEDVEKAFLSHATSKIKTENDLNFISTLGFRGEALPSIAAVSKISVLTKTPESKIGTRFVIEGGKKISLDEMGTPDGTTIIVKNLFFNTPARYKFLKTDRSEGNYVASTVDKMALSNPQVSFKFIRDNRIVLQTSGDGKLSNAIYSVFGKDFLETLIYVDLSIKEKKIYGFVSDPHKARKNRSMQHLFLNGRYIKSKTITSAIERAYEHSIMSGFFPACVLFLEIPFDDVDVNVHPSKLEVRFQNEGDVFSFVYHAVKNAISAKLNSNLQIDSNDIFINDDIDWDPVKSLDLSHFIDNKKTNVFYEKKDDEENTEKIFIEDGASQNQNFIDIFDFSDEENDFSEQEPTFFENVEKDIKYIGEVFGTYLIAQINNEVIIIDKHAAHEREIYNDLIENKTVEKQILTAPVIINCSTKEYDILLENRAVLKKSGFEIDDFGQKTIALRTCPAILIGEDLSSAILEAASYLTYDKNTVNDKLEWIYESIACRAAVKAGDSLSDYEKEKFVKRILNKGNLEFCPHGRPIYLKYTKSEIEKLFGRII